MWKLNKQIMYIKKIDGNGTAPHGYHIMQGDTKTLLKVLAKSLRRLAKSFIKIWDLPHAYVDVFSEATKHNYYQCSHVWAIQTVLTIIGIIWVAVE